LVVAAIVMAVTVLRPKQAKEQTPFETEQAYAEAAQSQGDPS